MVSAIYGISQLLEFLISIRIRPVGNGIVHILWLRMLAELFGVGMALVWVSVGLL